jgi:Protein of unknown function (DUF3800)
VERLHVYADESGNFDFSRHPKATKYYILTTVSLRDHTVGNDLLSLRRSLAWKGSDLPREFHATNDPQSVRDQVFGAIAAHDFRVDATIVNKPKTQLQVRPDNLRFYKTAWYYHMKYVAPRISQQGDELLVVAASITTRDKRRAFILAIQDVMQQVSPTRKFKTAFWPAATDPCLQVADYCCWAIQRKWEGGDDRSYQIIKSKIRSEFDLWKYGNTEYY